MQNEMKWREDIGRLLRYTYRGLPTTEVRSNGIVRIDGPNGGQGKKTVRQERRSEKISRNGTYRSSIFGQPEMANHG